MNEQEQILYMQARLLQMAMERWHISRQKAAVLFRRYGLASMIEENFDLYHMEGDDSVYDDIMSYLKIKEAIIDDNMGK